MQHEVMRCGGEWQRADDTLGRELNCVQEVRIGRYEEALVVGSDHHRRWISLDRNFVHAAVGRHIDHADVVAELIGNVGASPPAIEHQASRIAPHANRAGRRPAPQIEAFDTGRVSPRHINDPIR